MKRRSILPLAHIATLALLLLAADSPAATGEGGYPRNIAVSPSGDLVLITSEESNFISQIHTNAPGVVEHIDVGAPSWGVCFVDEDTAVVTLPSQDYVLVLGRDGEPGFENATQVPVPGNVGGQLFKCTEIIAGTQPRRVFVANRGRAPAGAGEWQHAVYEIDLDAGITQTFVGEREPRALAVSITGRLYVGYAQGALGEDGVISNTHFAGNAYPDKNLFDGGSILGFDVATGQVVSRFAVGSAVRGLAAWPPHDFAWQGGQIPTLHRLYFTSVGDGAQSENPDEGGRAIPNVIGSILLNIDDEPLDRQDTAVRHDPDTEPLTVTGSGALPTVLPEKLALSWDFDPIESSYSWRLWVTNSGSGTATRIDLDANDGAIVTGGSPIDLAAYGGFRVITGREADGHIAAASLVDADPANATLTLDTILNPANVYISAGPSAAGPYAGNPRGVTYDPVNDRIYAVTRLDHQLVVMNPAGPSVITQTTVREGGAPSGLFENDERKFFTFGRAFDFREDEGASPVNNLSCGTCHVDGHLDGKVRVTVRFNGNNANSTTPPGSVPVAVPSVFDVGNTEWLFFEGLTTIADRDGAIDVDGTCNYCQVNDFFRNTPEYTDTVFSPASPWQEDPASLEPKIATGRAWFDALNCSRCHAESAPGFVRTNDPEILSTSSSGPIGTTSRLLSDPTQVFITNVRGAATGKAGDPPPPEEQGSSLRNMTNVGTRGHENGLITRGVNTPALAGAWDNRPYFHDGRYRTLDQVLQHTWVQQQGAGSQVRLAAPIWSSPTVVDNYTNDPALAATSLLVPPTSEVEFNFHTHQSGTPGTSWTSVADFLTGTDKTSLLVFLESLSSQLDPYPDADLIFVQDLTVAPGDDPAEAVLNWETSLDAICRLTVENTDDETILVDRFTPLGSLQSETVTLNGIANWKATVTVSYGSQRITDEVQWTNEPQVVVSNFNKSHNGFCQVTFSWTTNVATACHFDWGPTASPDLPNHATTAFGTSHSVVVDITPGAKYRSEIWVDYQPVASTNYWSYKYCLPSKDQVVTAKAGIVAAQPNPFNPATSIHYRLDADGPADLRLYDLKGRLVRTLVAERRTEGEHVSIWDGKDDGGRPVASGVYFVRLRAQDIDSRMKIVLLE